MNPKRLAIVRIGHALLFAAAILFSSFVLAGTEHNQTLSGYVIPSLILALWFISSLFIPGTTEKIKCEWSWIRRVFGFSGNSTPKG